MMKFLDAIDQKIRRSFSDAAIQYDVLTSLHKEIGRELLKQCVQEPFDSILDIGMGTGWLTGKIKFYFPEACVAGIDFAEGMVVHAKNQGEPFSIIQADARALPFLKEQFDCILSNLAFQWVCPLEDGFKECAAVLKPGGQLRFTMFGFNTMDELFDSLEATSEGRKVSVRRLPSTEDVRRALMNAGFSDFVLDYERIKVHFPSMFDLLKWSKSIGANMLSKDVYIGKDWLHRANEFYQKKYHDRFGVGSTFEVIWVKAVKI